VAVGQRGVSVAKTARAGGGRGHEDLPGFRHEAFFYDSPEGFVGTTAAFVEAGLDAGEPVMVALLPEKLEVLRRRLGRGATQVRMVDMARLGRNPARIIPAWRRFVDDHPDSVALRGVGEPVWAARTPDELAECQRHEALLNTAFSAGRPWWLLCPYDTQTLAQEVLTEARHSHRYVDEAGHSCLSPTFGASPSVFAGTLADPGHTVAEQSFDEASLRGLRTTVAAWASEVLPPDRAADLVLVTHEVACNSVRHGGGGGTLRYWVDDEAAVVEVRDDGWLQEPLAGRELPSGYDEAGRGLWLANQLCDLVQLRSSQDGTLVRLRMSA